MDPGRYSQVLNNQKAALKEDLDSELTTILNADVAALTIWLRSQEEIVTGVAQDRGVVRAIRLLEGLADDPETAKLSLLQSSELVELRAESPGRAPLVLPPRLFVGDYHRRHKKCARFQVLARRARR